MLIITEFTLWEPDWPVQAPPALLLPPPQCRYLSQWRWRHAYTPRMSPVRWSEILRAGTRSPDPSGRTETKILRLPLLTRDMLPVRDDQTRSVHLLGRVAVVILVLKDKVLVPHCHQEAAGLLLELHPLHHYSPQCRKHPAKRVGWCIIKRVYL